MVRHSCMTWFSLNKSLAAMLALYCTDFGEQLLLQINCCGRPEGPKACNALQSAQENNGSSQEHRVIVSSPVLSFNARMSSKYMAVLIAHIETQM